MIKDFSATLTRKEHLAGEVWGFTFTMKDGETLEFKAGQYVLLKINENFRQYSFSSSPLQKDAFDLIVEFFPGGLASTYLDALEVGQQALFKGPAGVFTLQETELDKVYLATGTGIAPVKSMIETQLTLHKNTRAHLFFGLKLIGDMYLVDEIHALHKKYPESFTYTLCLSREGVENKPARENIIHGHIQDALELFWKNHEVSNFEYYICGSKPAVEALKEYVFQKGAYPDRIFFERFTL
ncbi:hypothetical protein KBC70_04470 [Candidatus Woesebacteria bacterium]|nr:hypothetical protein [Candidatus Woesebacteria bacterium]